MPVMENRPIPSEETDATGAPRRVAVTLAWGMTAPVGSATVPAMLPGVFGLTSWPWAETAIHPKVAPATASLAIHTKNARIKYRLPARAGKRMQGGLNFGAKRAKPAV